MAVFQRWDHFPQIIDRFRMQTNQQFRIHIWNNSGHKLDIGDFPRDRILIVDSPENFGSKARFYLLKEAIGNPVIFLDDDEEIDFDFVEHMYSEWKAYGSQTVLGWFGRAFTGESYWNSILNPSQGTEVDYIATKAMIIDRKIFELSPELLNLPSEYDGVEDLYLCVLARSHGMKLFISEKKSRSIEDGKDQYHKLHDEKERLFQKFRMAGWRLLKDDESSLPLVSVIIPCFNYGQCVIEAIQSILHQTFQDFEIIIVDDGSNDGVTRKVLSDIKHPRIKVIYQKNRGESAARNNGIRNARGTYILPLDADDKVHSTLIEKYVWLLKNNPSLGFAYSGVQFFGDRSGLFADCFYEYNFSRLLTRNFIHITSLFKKEDWERIGGFNESITEAEDWEFWLNMGKHGIYGQLLPEPLLFYRSHDASQSTTRTAEKEKIIFPEILKIHSDLFLPDNISKINDEWNNKNKSTSIVVSSEHVRGIAEYIRSLEEEKRLALQEIYQSRGWRIISFLHKIRMKIPIVNRM